MSDYRETLLPAELVEQARQGHRGQSRGGTPDRVAESCTAGWSAPR
jgi:hypothetical protein